MFLGLTEEQEMIVESVRAFVEQELYPYEDEVERTNEIRPELKDQIIEKALEQGFYAANMPAEYGGAGLDAVTLVLMERELGRANYGLEYLVARPSNILQACKGEQIEKYLLPTVRGEKIDCLAMSEPDAGSDVRSMKSKAVADGDDYIINGTKHFISHADIADYVILFVATGETITPKGPRNKITCFLVDKGTPGFTVLPGYEVVSHRGYHNSILQFDDCRVPATNILGELHHGFDVANDWLASTRLSVAATCLGRGYRALELCQEWAATRKQFGRSIGKFQGVSFKLADMATELEAAELLTLKAAWKQDQGIARDEDFAKAKLYSTEMLARLTDNAVQIFGGMGLANEFAIARMWRDARVERIWDGTSEIQRHIISRALLRPYEQK
ncbi:MAG: acyl-CoA dehydrogenase family protein [Ardenticatenaceae bacterium]